MHTHHRINTPKFTRYAFLLVLALVLCGCATTKKSETEKPKTNPPKLVGHIASIPPERKFVLIHSYGPWDVTTGSILTTRGDQNRTANLLFTGEKLGQFAAADIQSGTIERGDAVYSHHIPKPPVESLPVTPTTPATHEAPSKELPEAPLEPDLPDRAGASDHT